jgi:hypothetical protein
MSGFSPASGRCQSRSLLLRSEENHVACHVYADVFAASERDFHRIAATTGDSGVRLQRLEEWAAAFAIA